MSDTTKAIKDLSAEQDWTDGDVSDMVVEFFKDRGVSVRALMLYVDFDPEEEYEDDDFLMATVDYLVSEGDDKEFLEFLQQKADEENAQEASIVRMAKPKKK